MKPFITLSLTAIVGLFLGVVELLAGDAPSQTAKQALVGTWTLLSLTLEQGGKKMELFGANPRGQATFDTNGRFSIIVIRSDIPKFASNSRVDATPEENKAAVQGSLAFFGTYAVSEADRTYTIYIEGSTFPNWTATDQKRLFNITGDELKVTDPTSAPGATADIVWKRAK